MKNATHLLKTSQEYCTCHTKRLSTRYETHLNVTKCHACHAKRSNATFETSKSDPFCRTYHLGRAIRPSRGPLRKFADVCERLRNVERTHPQPPDPQSETGTLSTHLGGKNVIIVPIPPATVKAQHPKRIVKARSKESAYVCKVSDSARPIRPYFEHI